MPAICDRSPEFTKLPNQQQEIVVKPNVPRESRVVNSSYVPVSFEKPHHITTPISKPCHVWLKSYIM